MNVMVIHAHTLLYVCGAQWEKIQTINYDKRRIRQRRRKHETSKAQTTQPISVRHGMAWQAYLFVAKKEKKEKDLHWYWCVLKLSNGAQSKATIRAKRKWLKDRPNYNSNTVVGVKAKSKSITYHLNTILMALILRARIL